MRRATFAVVVLVVLSGCNAFGGTPATDGETVTPVDVPDVGPAETPTATPSERGCLVPRPAAAPNQSVADRAAASPLPRNPDDTVNGSALVDDHARALTNYSYHMTLDDNADVWAAPDLAAFTYEGVGLGLSAPWAYAVGGTLYTLSGDGGDLVLHEEPYEVGSPTHSDHAAILTGQRWLAERIAWFDYSVVDTRTWNGTEVRVLRDTLDSPALLGTDARATGVFRLNSTVYVDRRGIVRYVRHVRHIEYADETGFPNETELSTFRIDDVGTADIHRPAAFCVADPDDVRTPEATLRSPAEPSATAAPTAGPDTNESTTGAPTATPAGSTPGVEVDGTTREPTNATVGATGNATATTERAESS